MSRGLRVAITSVLALLVVASAAEARTYTGSLSAPSVSADGRSVSAQVSITSQCSATEYCGFFAEITTVPDSQSCADVITGSSWVGPSASYSYGATSASVSATAIWSEYPTLYSGGKRACLYALTDGVLVAQSTYTVPVPPPAYVPPATTTPTYTPTPVSTPTPTYTQPQSLGRDEASSQLRRYLTGRYGRKWRNGQRRTVKCPVRTSSAQLGCYAVWIYNGHVYSRTLIITESQTSYTISRSFATAPSQISVTSTAPSGDFCSTHVCIPNYPNGTGTTVRCSDGTYSQSGGRPGACSYHGGVARSAAVRTGVMGPPHLSAQQQRARLLRADLARRAALAAHTAR